MPLSSAFKPVSSKAHDVVDNARDTARSARDTLDEGRRALPRLQSEARRALDDGVEQFRTQASDYADQAGEQFDHARLYVTERVQERPFTATLAALGAGFVLGLLFAGGRK